MKRRLIRASLVLAALLGIVLFYYGYAPDPKLPKLSSKLELGELRAGDRERTYSYYLPANLPPNSPLLFVLHGSTQTGEEMRKFTGYGFDVLADREKFAVVYPDGFEGHWNDCRRVAPYAARTLNIDDKSFLLALIEEFQRRAAIDPSRVYAIGYSNGAQMAFRLAFQLSDTFAAIAAVAANLPEEDNLDCAPVGKPIPVLLISGTKDPISPYEGGEVTLFGFQNRGRARSIRATAEYFASRNGHGDSPALTSSPEIETLSWDEAGKPPVVLHSVIGGGHVIPQKNFRAPRVLGPTSEALDAPQEIWAFFRTAR